MRNSSSNCHSPPELRTKKCDQNPLSYHLRDVWGDNSAMFWSTAGGRSQKLSKHAVELRDCVRPLQFSWLRHPNKGRAQQKPVQRRKFFDQFTIPSDRSSGYWTSAPAHRRMRGPWQARHSLAVSSSAQARADARQWKIRAEAQISQLNRELFGYDRTEPSQSLKPVMILPQVHLRKPCYDFYFL